MMGTMLLTSLVAWAIICPIMLWVADILAKPYETRSTRSKSANTIACISLGAAFVAAAFKFVNPVQLAILTAFMTTLVLLAIIDARLKILPNKVTVPLFLIGVALSFTGYTIPWQHSLLGAATGFLMLFLPGLLFSIIRGKRGVGFGDVKLMAGVGAWLGWLPLLPILVIAGLGAAIVGTIYLKTRKLHANTYIPFGPFLVGGTILIMLFL